MSKPEYKIFIFPIIYLKFKSESIALKSGVRERESLNIFLKKANRKEEGNLIITYKCKALIKKSGHFFERTVIKKELNAPLKRNAVERKTEKLL